MYGYGYIYIYTSYFTHISFEYYIIRTIHIICVKFCGTILMASSIEDLFQETWLSMELRYGCV